MPGHITIQYLPPELLLEAFQHLSELEPLGTIDYPEESDDAASLSESNGDSDSTTTSADDDYTDEELSSGSQSVWYPFSLAWTRVTHVCSRWRHLALSTPTLWSFIPLNLPRAWADELFRRTNMAPLDIYIPENYWGDRQTARMYDIIGSPRVRRITSEDTQVPILDIIGNRSWANIDNHTLEELTVATYLFPLLNLTQFKSLRRVDVDFKSNASSLGALSEFTDINIPSLTELRLVMHRPYTDTSVTLPAHWTAVLDKLTVLKLEFVRFNFSSGQDEILLPRLRELRIAENKGYCGDFVRHARTPFLKAYAVRHDSPNHPSSTDLHGVKALGFARVLDDADITIPALHTLAIAHILTSFSALVHVHAWRFGNSIANDTKDFPVHVTEMAPVDADISHNMDLENHTGVTMMSNFAITLLQHPLLSALRMLSLDLSPDLHLGDMTTWVELLRPMDRLEHFRVTAIPTKHFGVPTQILRALQAQPDVDGFVVPLLKRLTLVDWDPDVGARLNNEDPEESGIIVRRIALDRVRDAPLRYVRIVSWRQCHDEAWERHLTGLTRIEVSYDQLLVHLDHIHATDEESAANSSREQSPNLHSPVPFGPHADEDLLGV